MWKSIGDKFDLVDHVNAKRPRRIKTNAYALLIIALVFVVSRFTFRQMMSEVLGDYGVDVFVSVVFIVSIVATLILIALKYLRNDREIDLALIILVFVLILSSFLIL